MSRWTGRVLVLAAFLAACNRKPVDEDGDGLSVEDGDCDDGDADVGAPSEWYIDGDGDDYGSGAAVSACEQPAQGVEEAGDCDDVNADVNPGHAEVSCNGLDDDCDGDTDEDGPVWYTDKDGDGYGDDSAPIEGACEQPAGSSSEGGDCDDSDAAYHPGALETDCNDANDYNCDGSTGFVDADQDGFAACDDCDDTNAAVSPDAQETCDGVDNDCDGDVDGADASDPSTWYADADGDGAGDVNDAGVQACSAPPGTVASHDDCDDANAATNPSGQEVCDGNDVDEDCDGSADDADPSATGQSSWYPDADSDTYGDDAGAAVLACDAPAGTSASRDDCDDADPAYNPGAAETDCTDKNDYNCDGSTGFADADNDGFAACADCNDLDAAIRPDATEVAADLVDQDCDGKELCYVDADDDEHGTNGTATSTDMTCGTGLSLAKDDCDDADAADFPGASETIGNQDDEDCNGTETCYTDVDDDGHGIPTAAESADTQCGTKLATVADDCDDAAGTDFPGASEVAANGNDEDCDGGDTCYQDLDKDGVGTATTVASADLSCADPGESSKSNDCDDADVADFPGATETVGNQDDEDCDGTEICYVDADDDGFGVATTASSTNTQCGTKLATVPGDCDDVDAADNPGATETAGNGDDDDCNSAELCYVDGDQDGQGTTSTVVESSDAGFGCDVANKESGVSTDCDDADKGDYLGATEVVGNNDDEDCDAKEQCYGDGDQDGQGSKIVVTESPDAGLTCDTANKESGNGTDCDDLDKGDYVGATETVGNGDDEDCDGKELCFQDNDQDTQGSKLTVTESADAGLTCDTGSKESPNSNDCDDASKTVYTGAAEVVADGIDQDCNLVDVCYVDNDADGQGKGTANSNDLDCVDAKESKVGTDCDDTDAGDYAGATEIIGNNDDESCDGKEQCYQNLDKDTYGTSTVVTENAADTDLNCETAESEGTRLGDCDDTDNRDFPGATETVGNNDDESCDGIEQCYKDGDKDGQGSSTVVSESGDPGLTCDTGSSESTNNRDCDDADAGDYLGAVEIVGNGDDEDCNGTELCYVDGDQDGQGSTVTTAESADAGLVCSTANKESSNSTDCDDADKGDYVGALETIGNGDDEDCDGAELCFVDKDADTYGNSNKSTVAESADAGLSCDTASGEADDATDCDDKEAGDYPGATETVANSDDEDCDGAELCYVDRDKDSYGNSNGSTVVEGADAGLVCETKDSEADDVLDCDDLDPADYTGAVEVTANGDDDDCNGLEKCYQNNDNDPYGTNTLVDSTDLDCADGGESGQVLDCDDADPRRYPGLELCDGRQNDCAATWSNVQENGKVTYFPPSGTGFTEATAAWAAGSNGAPAAITLPATGTVEVCRGTYYVSLVTASSPGALAINGRYGEAFTNLSGGDVQRVLRVSGAAANVTATGLTFTDGRSTAAGGAIWLQSGALRLTQSTVRDSLAGSSGGGIQADALIRLNDVEVLQNVATTDGGGIAGAVNCTLCDVHDNDAGDAGGGIYATDLTVNNSQVWSNFAVNGGGVAYEPTSAIIGSITSTSIDNNVASNGGGLWTSGLSGALSFSFSSVTQNLGVLGGGLYVSGVDLVISGTAVDDNDADKGGGLYQTGGADVACSGTVADASGMQLNAATVGGGGIWRDTLAGTTQSNTCDWGVGAADNNTPQDVWDAATSTATNYGDNATFSQP